MKTIKQMISELKDKGLTLSKIANETSICVSVLSEVQKGVKRNDVTYTHGKRLELFYNSVMSSTSNDTS